MNLVLPNDDWSTLSLLQSIFQYCVVRLVIWMILQHGRLAPKRSRVNRWCILIGRDAPMGNVFADDLEKRSTDGESISSVLATHPLFAIVSWLLLSFVFVSENSSGLSSSGVLLRIG